MLKMPSMGSFEGVDSLEWLLFRRNPSTVEQFPIEVTVNVTGFTNMGFMV